MGATLPVIPPCAVTVMIGKKPAARMTDLCSCVAPIPVPVDMIIFGSPTVLICGLPASRLLWIKADGAASRLWAAEQALRCAEAAAVLAWLPQAQGPQLRRLHLAAQQHRRLLFVMRPQAAQGQASPARLRLRIEPGEPLKVHVIKRRGAPLASPVLLPAQHDLLSQLLQARQGEGAWPLGEAHGLDRLAALA